MNIISFGEVLWDIFEKGVFLGGAPLNLSANLRKFGHSVAFVSAVGEDDLGTQVLDGMRSLGLPT